MTSTLVSISTALMLGLLHALEVDHMIAVTTFVARRPGVGLAARFGLRWGIGHSLAVITAGSLLLVTGLRWPSRFDAIAEGLVGAMLVGLGAWALRSSRKLHFHPPAEHGDHAHLHAHGGSPEVHLHQHPSEQPSRVQHAHDGHGITLVGLMHGLAGTSAVVALLPVTLMTRLETGFLYLLAFGVGVTAGMTVYSILAAVAMRQAISRSVALGRLLAGGVGALGILVGLGWLWRAVG